MERDENRAALLRGREKSLAAEVGDFLVFRFSEDSYFVDRISTMEGTEILMSELEPILSQPDEHALRAAFENHL